MEIIPAFRIGVIGGAGVAATNMLLQLMEQKITMAGASRDAHHPEMIVWQATAAPSRSLFFEGRGPSFIDDYVHIGEQLKNIGAACLCMCCNTAHATIAEMESRIGLPFVNLVDEVALAAYQSGARRIGLLASDGCLKSQVYEKSLSRYAPDVEIVYPDAEMQAMVTSGICGIKTNRRFLPENHPDRPRQIFTHIVNKLRMEDCDSVIIGCTDIRADFAADGTIDSLEVLAHALVQKFKEHEAT